MKWLIGIGLLIVLAGCAEVPTGTPLTEIEPDCTSWTICISSQHPSCLTDLNPEQAQSYLDILEINEIPVAAIKCTEEKEWD